MGPRITYYDDATGERIELSTVTLANWAAKTANLLRDEFGAGPGSRVAVLLPAHWQTAAVLLGVWWIGAEVVLSGSADLALCTSERLDEADEAVAGGEVAVLSLDPFGKPVADLPIGVTDYATAVRVHGDQFITEPAPGPALAGRSADEVLASGFRIRGRGRPDRGRSGDVVVAVVHPRRGGGESVGGVRHRRVAGSGGQSRPGRPGAPPDDREGVPRSALSCRARARMRSLGWADDRRRGGHGPAGRTAQPVHLHGHDARPGCARLRRVRHHPGFGHPAGRRHLVDQRRRRIHRGAACSHVIQAAPMSKALTGDWHWRISTPCSAR